MSRLAAALLAAAAATLAAPPASATAPARSAVTAGSPLAATIRFEFAVYYLPAPAKDPLPLLRRLAGAAAQPRLVVRLADEPPEAQVQARMENDVRRRYRPPDMSSLQYSGRGLSRAQAEALQNAERALILDFGHSGSQAFAALRRADELAEQVARETGGLLWDEATREVFTPDEWHKRRLAGWPGGVPDVSTQTTIHAYKSTEFVRAITLGMAKFGLPDVVVDDFSWSMNRPVGHLINLFCQAMAEGARVGPDGVFDLDLQAIRHPAVRQAQLATLKVNAEAVARLALRPGTREQGDPDNRLIQIGFDRYPGGDAHARQDRMLSSLFGWEDSVAMVRHDAALTAASRKARAQLPALREAFRQGLRPGEFIQVKAPFATPDGGNEWMWVEVTRWTGEAIEGLLKNEPVRIPGLHGGQIVTVRQPQVFDYIRRFPDGTEEGNGTAEIIRKMQGQTGK